MSEERDRICDENQVLARLEADVERATGRPVAELRAETLCDARNKATAKCGFATEFVRHFPRIGRGNVLGDRTVTHAYIEEMLDEALK